MAMDQATQRYTGAKITPKFPHKAVERSIPIGPNQSFPQGQVLGMTTANVSDVQTFTCTGTPTAGSFAYLVQNPLSLETLPLTIPFNCTAAVLQGIANLIFNQSISSTVNIATSADTTVRQPNVVATGGPWPGTPLVLTGAGLLQFGPITVAVPAAGGNLLTGGSSPTSTVAHTAVGSQAGVGVIYNSTLVPAPTAAAVASATAGSTTWVAGDHDVVYTLVTPGGESTASPEDGVVLTAGQGIAITSITGLNAAVTAVNFYVDGLFCQTAAVTAGATGAVTLGTATLSGLQPPSVNRAYAAPGGAGSQIAQFIAKYPVTTDANGRITIGNVIGGAPSWGYTEQVVDVFINGMFDLQGLTGLDNNAVYVQQPPLGRISEGSSPGGKGTLNMI